MSELPDFSRMTEEQIGDWFLNNDTSALIATAERATVPFVQVDEHGKPVMKPATFRLPPSLLSWLEQAGRARPRGQVRNRATGADGVPRAPR